MIIIVILECGCSVVLRTMIHTHRLHCTLLLPESIISFSQWLHTLQFWSSQIYEVAQNEKGHTARYCWTYISLTLVADLCLAGGVLERLCRLSREKPWPWVRLLLNSLHHRQMRVNLPSKDMQLLKTPYYSNTGWTVATILTHVLCWVRLLSYQSAPWVHFSLSALEASLLWSIWETHHHPHWYQLHNEHSTTPSVLKTKKWHDQCRMIICRHQC